MTNQKKRVLGNRDEGKSLTYQYSDDSTYTSKQRVCRFSHLLSNRETEVAEGSAQQAWCEQRVCRLPPSVENRDSVGFTNDSHHSANQLEQRASLPHFHAGRSRIVHVEGSNQKGRSPIQYSRIPTQKMPFGTYPPPAWGGITSIAKVGTQAVHNRQTGTNGTGKSTEQYRRCRWVPPTSMGRHHPHH